MRGDKACEDLGAEPYLQYVEHPNRVQPRQRPALWFRSRKLVRKVGWRRGEPMRAALNRKWIPFFLDLDVKSLI